MCRFDSGSKLASAVRSQLVGMYLSQANSRDAYSPEIQENRQRRNGKFASTRERA